MERPPDQSRRVNRKCCVLHARRAFRRCRSRIGRIAGLRVLRLCSNNRLRTVLTLITKLPLEIDSEDVLPEYGCPVLVTSHAGDLNEVCLWCFPAVGNVATNSVLCFGARQNCSRPHYAPFQFRAYRPRGDVQNEIGVA